MPFNFKKVQELQLQYAIFGKLPRRADFIRVNASHPAAVDIDQQLANSLKHLSNQDAWQEIYLQAPNSEVLFHSKDGRWSFFGIVLPSHDEALRHYPLVAGVCIAADILNGGEAEFVLANELFFSGLKEQLKNAAENSVEMVACRQFMEEQMAFSHRAAADLELASHLLERHMAKTSIESLESALRSAGHADLESIILSFAFYLQLVRRYGASLPAQVFMLPLPTGAGEEILGAAVWMSLCRAAIQSQGQSVLNFAFVTQGGIRYLALSFNAFTELQLSMLWGQQLDLRQIVDASDVKSPWRSHQFYAEASYILGRQLSDPLLSLFKLREIIFKITAEIS